MSRNKGRTVITLFLMALFGTSTLVAAAVPWSIGVGKVPLNGKPAGLHCRIVDPDAGTMEVRIRKKTAEVLYLQDDHGGFFLVRDFRKVGGDPSLRNELEVPDRVTISLLSDLTARSIHAESEEQIKLIHRPGNYGLISTANHETEIENIKWLGICPFTVSGSEAPLPTNWRIAEGEQSLNTEKPEPAGLRCRIIDPVKGIIEVGIVDKRAHILYLMDDHGGMYLIRRFEQPNPEDRYRHALDTRLTPDALRVNVFRDMTVPHLYEDDHEPIRMIHRRGTYRIMSAEHHDGEASLIDWLGKCTFAVQ